MSSSSTRAFSSCIACRSDPRASSSATGSGSLLAASSFVNAASAAVALFVASGVGSSEAGCRVDEVAFAGICTILSEPASTTTLLEPGRTGGRLWGGPLDKLLPSRARSMRWLYRSFAGMGATAVAPAGDASGDGVVALLGQLGVEGASQSAAGSERPALRFECALITSSCRVATSRNFLSAPLTDLQYNDRMQAQMQPTQTRQEPTATVTETTSTTGKLLPVSGMDGLGG